mgnify:CR=1 FL=1
MADSNWDTIVIWMNEHADRLVRTVTAVTGDSEEAQDIVQETFIRAYRALGGFRGTCNPYTFFIRDRNQSRTIEKTDACKETADNYVRRYYCIRIR